MVQDEPRQRARCRACALGRGGRSRAQRQPESGRSARRGQGPAPDDSGNRRARRRLYGQGWGCRRADSRGRSGAGDPAQRVVSGSHMALPGLAPETEGECDQMVGKMPAPVQSSESVIYAMPLAHDAKAAAEIPDISVVVPIYREEKTVRLFLSRIEPVLETTGSYEIIFCYDPSPDRTKEIILEEILRNPRIRLLAFSRRFGQPSAVMAGLHHCIGKTCVVIDADLQDPPELIPELYRKLHDGHDVVLAKRRRRDQGEPLIRRWISFVGYRVINALADIDIPRNTGEFRIMTRRVVDELCRLKEGHGFLRGLVAFVGFDQALIEFDRPARAAGTSSYSQYFGSLRVGINGVIGFSNALLTATLMAGLVIAAAAL